MGRTIQPMLEHMGAWGLNRYDVRDSLHLHTLTLNLKHKLADSGTPFSASSFVVKGSKLCMSRVYVCILYSCRVPNLGQKRALVPEGLNAR